MERRWSFHPSMNVTVELNQMPDVHGHFGPYGGVFVPETLMPAIQELTEEYERARRDPKFRLELEGLLSSFCGRPTPLYYAERLSERLQGPRIYLKRRTFCTRALTKSITQWAR